MKGELGDLTIHVAVDKEAKTLTVTDRGVGMTAEEVDKYINQIAFSGAEEFMEKYKNQSIIGHFGLGFYSSFMVADKVEIFTKSYKKGRQVRRYRQGQHHQQHRSALDAQTRRHHRGAVQGVLS